MHLSLDKITIDAGTQARVSLNKQKIAEYAESMREGDQFDPCLVFFDGEKNYLVDGFHRYFAARKIKAPSINCVVQQGTLDDAIFKSWSANSRHGQPRTRADIRKAIMSALAHPIHGEKSSREIAKICDCSHFLVLAIKKEVDAARGQKEKPKARVQPVEDLPDAEIPDENDVFQEEMAATIELLKAENEALSDKLAIAAMDADELDKAMAESVIKDLRAQIRLLEIEVKAVTESRDTLMRENAQLMRQVNSLTKKLKKSEG